jgi:hypothetical protein
MKMLARGVHTSYTAPLHAVPSRPAPPSSNAQSRFELWARACRLIVMRAVQGAKSKLVVEPSDAARAHAGASARSLTGGACRRQGRTVRRRAEVAWPGSVQPMPVPAPCAPSGRFRVVLAMRRRRPRPTQASLQRGTPGTGSARTTHMYYVYTRSLTTTRRPLSEASGHSPAFAAVSPKVGPRPPAALSGYRPRVDSKPATPRVAGPLTAICGPSRGVSASMKEGGNEASPSPSLKPAAPWPARRNPAVPSSWPRLLVPTHHGPRYPTRTVACQRGH